MIVEYKPEHLKQIRLQEAQAVMGAYLNDEDYAAQIAVPGLTYTAIEGDRVTCCGGLLPQWEGRAQAWTLVAGEVMNFLQIHRAALRLLDGSGFRRIEAMVDSDFDNGREWMRLLGFEWEGRMRKWSPQGRDFDLYARVK